MKGQFPRRRRVSRALGAVEVVRARRLVGGLLAAGDFNATEQRATSGLAHFGR